MNKLFGDPGYEPGTFGIFIFLATAAMILTTVFSACTPTTPRVYPQRTYHLVLLDGSEQDVVYAWCTTQSSPTGLVVKCYDRDYAWTDPLLTVTVQSIREVRD